MRALLLSAGFGSRLKPYTNKIPKCLMKIKGRELLDIWICSLVNFGIDKILINTHYKHKKIEEFILNHKYKNKIELVYEKKLLNTAGTLLKNKNFFKNNDGIFIHSDNLLKIKMKPFLKAHKNRPKQCLLTMLTFKADYPQNFGTVVLNNQKIVKNYYEKVVNPPTNIANGAIFILSKKFISEITHKKFYNKDFCKEVLNNYINRIYTYNFNGQFNDIGSVSNFLKVR